MPHRNDIRLTCSARNRFHSKVNSICSTAHLFTGALEDVPVNAEFSRIVEGKLLDLLAEITDVSIPWRRTAEKETCDWCDFKAICGR